MKRELFFQAFCLLLLFPSSSHAQDALTTAVVKDSTARMAAQNSTSKTNIPDSLLQNYEIEVFQNVLKMADIASFKYKEVLSKAKTGDIGAIKQMLDFHKVVDGADALNHGVTCLELLSLAGDGQFASAVSLCKPKLKELVLERLMLAQGRTKKPFLRQSLTNWAPITWAYLNGIKIPTQEQKPEPESTLDGGTNTLRQPSNSVKKQ